ncbi:hypothetical protein LEP1GSC008_4162 [Leptospira kirschneri serovar Bulgarica str. Nikolaevo]|uniref:Uncharacterized protein n=1 Tax=Leptospira kirschneri serovar Bulgarica str. Nikolaevo TaxID=1240687 RepID=M6EZ26_9LEPT|nr:hypothetical protein LEP1GSC008_4162 [Leptospira kirschneri serovar Bulgarica str. Nikolaevo]
MKRSLGRLVISQLVRTLTFVIVPTFSNRKGSYLIDFLSLLTLGMQ